MKSMGSRIKRSSGAKMPGVGRGNNPASHRHKLTPGTQLKIQRNDSSLSHGDKSRISDSRKKNRKALGRRLVDAMSKERNALQSLMALPLRGLPERRSPSQIKRSEALRLAIMRISDKHGLW